MTLIVRFGFLLLLGAIPICRVIGQGMEDYGSGAKLKLNESGTHYIRFITWLQMWGRYQDLNPNSVINGTPQETNLDLSLRRGRFLVFGEFGKGTLFMFHIGINNQTWMSGGAPGEPTGTGKKPQLFIHDFWFEQHVIKDHLSLGVGLHYWWGISREANASTLNFLALDAPIYNWPEVDLTDQFARQFGIYAKGNIDAFQYRVMLNRPFRPGVAAAPQQVFQYLENESTFNSFANTWAFGGYFLWQFWDKESDLLPYTVGTYLGTKKVFNIGAGFYVHPDANATLRSLSERTTLNVLTAPTTPGSPGFRYQNFLQPHNQVLLGMDLFLDWPFGEGIHRSAWTWYSVFYHYNFGPNYVRNIGIMNYATPVIGERQSFNGPGNAFPVVGTGQIIRIETGYLLPASWFDYGGRLQPFATFNHMNFERLHTPAVMLEFGANYLIEGHHAKYSFLWRQRPIYSVVEGSADGPNGLPRVEESMKRGEWILQAMIYF